MAVGRFGVHGSKERGSRRRGVHRTMERRQKWERCGVGGTGYPIEENRVFECKFIAYFLCFSMFLVFYAHYNWINGDF